MLFSFICTFFPVSCGDEFYKGKLIPKLDNKPSAL